MNNKASRLPNPERPRVLAAAVHMNNAEVKEHWVGKVFRGSAVSDPLPVPSHGLASEFVSTIGGAVSFMCPVQTFAEI